MELKDVDIFLKIVIKPQNYKKSFHELKSEEHQMRHIQILAIRKKIHILCPILMKLGENHYLMS